MTSGTGPIFVGGTGRSGTSVMADLLNSHPGIVLPAHENKLIVEKDGLRDLVEALSGPYDIKRRHYAMANFVRWAKKLRSLGFRDKALNEQVQALMRDQRMRFHNACEAVARQHPGADLSIHAVGQGFDYAHYDACANGLIRTLMGQVVDEGIIDTEGLIKPFLIPQVMSRAELLEQCRAYLDGLYQGPMTRAAATRWCDDTPDNWLYFDFLFELYPDMRFIHMIRDPRDVVGSYMKQVWAPSDPKIIVQVFKAQFADYEALRRRVPADRVIEIRLEDISADKARVLASLSAFLGVENHFDAGLFFNEKTNTGAYAAGLGPEVTALIETELADWMGHRGYLA